MLHRIQTRTHIKLYCSNSVYARIIIISICLSRCIKQHSSNNSNKVTSAHLHWIVCGKKQRVWGIIRQMLGHFHNKAKSNILFNNCKTTTVKQKKKLVCTNMFNSLKFSCNQINHVVVWYYPLCNIYGKMFIWIWLNA